MSCVNEIVSRLFESKSSEDVVCLRDIIDTWNMIEKYGINYTTSKDCVVISKKDYQELISKVKNPRYIKNLRK